MTRYVFDKPEQMFDWIDTVAKKLLSIPRKEFGKIEVNIRRSYEECNYPFIIEETDRNAWRRKFENENVRKDV